MRPVVKTCSAHRSASRRAPTSGADAGASRRSASDHTLVSTSMVTVFEPARPCSRTMCPTGASRRARPCAAVLYGRSIHGHTTQTRGCRCGALGTPNDVRSRAASRPELEEPTGTKHSRDLRHQRSLGDVGGDAGEYGHQQHRAEVCGGNRQRESIDDGRAQLRIPRQRDTDHLRQGVHAVNVPEPHSAQRPTQPAMAAPVVQDGRIGGNGPV
jgi:hypothetical protein